MLIRPLPVRPARRAGLVLLVAASLLLTGCGAAHRPALAGTPTPASTPIPTAERLALPAHPRVYFFGDSWTEGHSAAPHEGFVEVTAAALGWTAVRSPTGSGTGFVHVYARAGKHREVYPDRAAALPAFDADAIVVEGGINDVGFDLTGYAGAIDSTIARLREKAGGDVPVIVMGPAPFTFPISASAHRVDALLRAGAARDDYEYVSPMAEGWFTPANVHEFIDPDTLHPDTAGHAYLGARLAADVRALEAPEG